jgi:hypothetical protein
MFPRTLPLVPAAKRRRRRQLINLLWWLAICGLFVAFIDVMVMR